jgi:glutamate 5-kinase
MQFPPQTLNTLIVKIGTSLLSGQRAFEGQVMEAVVKEMCRLKREHDLNILIVTSGAVGCGMNALKLTERPVDVPLKQAVAAVGQATLMHYYETLFLTYGDNLHTAQVLLTLADLDNRLSYLNVRNTLQTLFNMKSIIPILNENDSTAVDQLRFGDNDTLAAKISAKINAGLLVILTDIDGLYNDNPTTNPEAQLITRVDTITQEIEACAGGAGSISSTGGMITKIEAARIACAAGVPVVIANGHRPNIVHGILDGSAPCTLFSPNQSAISHRKRWIAFGRATRGVLHVDEGACNALINQGKSLLPAGIINVEGNFDAGAAVKIQDNAGRDIARALVNYSSQDIRKILGHKSNEIRKILGQKAFDEVVHRDNLVLL